MDDMTLAQIEEFKTKKILELVASYRPEQGNYKRDDILLSDILEVTFKDYLTYCPELHCWMVYDGTRWIQDTGAIAVRNKTRNITRILQRYASTCTLSDSDKSDFNKFIDRLGGYTTRQRIISDCESNMATSICDFDANPYLINCENGTYDLATDSFHSHTPSDKLTMIAACLYPVNNTDYQFDRWLDFIDEITCGDKEVAQYLQTALGYSLGGIAAEECMFIAHGKTTRNGKSTLLNAVFELLGDYARNINSSFICSCKGERSYAQADPMVCVLKGARFVVMNESDENNKLDEASVKSYTGRDPITTRQLYSEAFTFIPQFVMWMSCNSLLAVNDRSVFSSDRIKVIEFNRHFKAAERDKTLKARFSTPEARCGIFKWLTDGYKMYKQNGLHDIKQIADAVNAYETRNNRVGMFVEEMCTVDEDVRCNRADLYKAYKDWCSTNGMFAKSAQKFYDEIDAIAEQVWFKQDRQYKGICLKTQAPTYTPHKLVFYRAGDRHDED